MIVEDEAGRVDVLTTSLATGEEALPVFSFEDEARMFLELGALGADWRVRVTSPGELISVLFCLCASVKRVALDPLPDSDGAALNDLVSMEREAFVESLLNTQLLPQFESRRSAVHRPADVTGRLKYTTR